MGVRCPGRRLGRLAAAASVALGLLVGVANAQAPATQCVSTALAGGTGDAITIPVLPCGVTTTLLLLTISTTNATTTPTLQMVTAQAQPIVEANGGSLAVGELQVGSVVLLTNNGTEWLKLSNLGVVVAGPGVSNIGGPAVFSNTSGSAIADLSQTTHVELLAGAQSGSAPHINTLYEQYPGDLSTDLTSLYPQNAAIFWGFSNRINEATDRSGATAGTLGGGLVVLVEN